MELHTLTVDEALSRLDTCPDGLSGVEAAGRLSEYGPNTLAPQRRVPLYMLLAAQFTHFMAVLLWVAAALCVVSGLLHPGEGTMHLAAAIVSVIAINAVFTFVQEYRAEKALMELSKLMPYRVRALRDGSVRELGTEDVAVGDIVLLTEGDRVPADARVVEANRLTVNNAPLTGESRPLERAAGPATGDYLESPNLVFAGTLVVGGTGRAAVYATGMATEFGRVAHLTGSVEHGPSPLQKEITRVTRTVSVIAASLGVLFFLVGFAMGRGFWHNFLFAIGIIIANVPEGLLPTVTLSLAMGSQRMARRNALVRKLSSVEALGSVSVICTDKTGTITTGGMEVREVWTPSDAPGRHVPACSADAPDLPASPGPVAALRLLHTAAWLCNNAAFVPGAGGADGGYKGEPTEAALLKAAREALGGLTARRVAEAPFDPDRKRMSTVNVLEGRTFVFTKGAPESVLSVCSSVLSGGGPAHLTDELSAGAMAGCNAMMARGYRVIAAAYRELSGGSAPVPELPEDVSSLESGMVFLGLFGLEDPPRPEAAEAVRRCAGAGIRVIMITGDAGGTALSIARQVGIAGDGAEVLEGARVESMTDAGLSEALSGGEIVFARMTPRQKMRVVSVLKDEGERVAVTGDGVNDAPALKKADVGVAMGKSGTDVAREAADIVLMDDNFATIVNAVEEGRAVFENIRKFASYIFASNIPEIVPYLAYVLLGIPLPLTIMQILAVDLGTDMFPALALGAERPTPELMNRPPRPRGERLLNLKLLGRSYFFLGPFEALAGMYAYFHVLFAGGWRWGAELPPDSTLYMTATSACLAGIIVTQVANVFACRSSELSVFRLGIFSNRLVLHGIALEAAIAAAIFYLPFANAVFGTAPLSAGLWLMLVPFGFLLFGAEEARKFFVGRFRGGGHKAGERALAG